MEPSVAISMPIPIPIPGLSGIPTLILILTLIPIPVLIIEEFQMILPDFLLIPEVLPILKFHTETRRY